MPRELLAEEDRKKRRTLADALEVLRVQAGFTEYDQATIKIWPLDLPSGEMTYIVQLFFDSVEKTTYVVGLPTADKFEGRREQSAESDTYSIEWLNDALVFGDGSVVTRRHHVFRAIKVLPSRLPLNPSELSYRIVAHTVSFLKAEDRCCPHILDDIVIADKEEQSQMDALRSRLRIISPSSEARYARVREPKFIDYGLVRNLSVPSLKDLHDYIVSTDRGLKSVCPQTVADALLDFGIRIPKERPRKSKPEAVPS